MMVHFTIPGEPKGKQRPKFTTIAGHAKAITPKDTVSYENLVKMEYHSQSGLYFADQEPVYILIDCYMSMPQSTTKRKRSAMLERVLRPLRKVDWDNAGKIICDSLNKIAYHDDAQVVDGRVRKFYAEQPRVEVYIADKEIDTQAIDAEKEGAPA